MKIFTNQVYNYVLFNSWLLQNDERYGRFWWLANARWGFMPEGAD